MILNLKLPEAGVAIVTDLTALATIAIVETHWLSLAPDGQRFTPRGDEIRLEYERLRTSGLVEVVDVVWWARSGVGVKLNKKRRTIITEKGKRAFRNICAELRGVSWPIVDPTPTVDVPDSSVG